MVQAEQAAHGLRNLACGSCFALLLVLLIEVSGEGCQVCVHDLAQLLDVVIQNGLGARAQRCMPEQRSIRTTGTT